MTSLNTIFLKIPGKRFFARVEAILLLLDIAILLLFITNICTCLGDMTESTKMISSSFLFLQMNGQKLHRKRIMFGQKQGIEPILLFIKTQCSFLEATMGQNN